MHLRYIAATVALIAALAAGACSGSSKQGPAPGGQAKPAAAAAAGDEVDVPAYEAALPEALRPKITENFTGDLDGMIARRMIRVGVTFNRTFYFVDQGTQRGLAYEYLLMFEDQLNKTLKTGNLRVHLVPLPMPRDLLLPSLQSGKIDMVVAQLTITPSRQAVVDFSRPTRRNVSEVVVSAPGTPPLASPEDLAGREVFVRKTSSYYESLVALNRALEAKHKKPVDVQLASESLEDDDLLEMVNAGLIPATVVDNYVADFWKQMFKDMIVHDGLALRTNGELGVAFRKNSPKLAEAVNGFVAKVGLDSAIGAILNKRYLQSTKYAKNATSEAERKKFIALVDLFRKYGDQYQFDFLMMAAQGYQESRLDQKAKSSVGAIGIMQLMPQTGKEQKVGDIRKVDPNVHAGVKYMRFIRDSFFENEPMDDLNKALFTFAAYNAGPGRIRQLRREAEQRGLNPNLWFGNVERVASERIGRETVTYVSNIYKYYVAYRLVAAENARKKAAVAHKGH